jgi:Type II secretion system (T2SS), protein E, N-terminal domain
MSRLGETLVEAGVIDPPQLVAGLSEQILTGGRLGSQLVALGLVRPAILGQWLARATGVEAADLVTVHSAPRAWLPEDVARREMALPIAVVGELLRCAMTEPRDQARVERLRQVVKRPIDPRVAAEGALLDAIDRGYAGGEAAAKTEPAGAIHGARTPQQATRSMRPAGPTRPKALPISAADGQRLLDDAQDRDGIAHALVMFARGRLDGAIVFTLRQGRAHAWRAEGLGPEAEPLDRVVLPIAATPWLERTAPARTRTTAPAGLAPLQGPTRELVTIPVVFAGRVVNVVAGVVRTGIADPTLRALELYAAAAVLAYERLIARLAG